MEKKFGRVIFLTWLLLLPGLALAAATSIVPQAVQISSEQARWQLVNALAAVRGREAEALRELDRLGPTPQPEATLLRLRSDLLFRPGRRTEAEQILRRVAVLEPRDRSTALALGNLLAARGEAAESQQWFDRALALGATTAERQLMARQVQGWGDFSRAATLLEKSGPVPPLEEAALRRGQQRFAEAEELYRRVLQQHPRQREALVGLALTALLAKEYATAIHAAEEGLRVLAQDADLLDILGAAQFARGDWAAARATFGQLSQSGPAASRAKGYIGLGRVAAKLGEDEEAAAAFARAARLDPLGAAFYAQETVGEKPAFRTSLSPTTENLHRWGELLLSTGSAEAAADFFAQAREKQPGHFGARLGHLEALAAQKDFAGALAELDTLRAAFPDNEKLELTRARLLSWQRHYRDSVAAYAALSARDPTHPVFHRERARVQAWNKHMRAATADYRKLWAQPVDAAVAAVTGETLDPDEPPFAFYESWDHPEAPAAVRAVLDRERAAYRLQKSAWLEARAKNHAWNRHFLRAAATLEELAAFDPGNQEARFDLAQARSAQNLHAGTRAAYTDLLTLDPLHQQAGWAMERENLLDRPSLSTRFLYLDEEGTDRLAEIDRFRLDTVASFTWRHQTQLEVAAINWFELPGETSRRFQAFGPAARLFSTLNRFWSFEGSLTYKHYFENVPDTWSGSALVTFNAWDVVQITGGYVREEVLHNLYAIEQGTQANLFRLDLRSALNHWVEVEARQAAVVYNDNNTGFEGLYTADLILLDHPRTLQLTLGGEYRDTQKQSESVFTNGELTNVISPYWTPQNYVRGFLWLEWRHDVAREFFARAEQHYYLLRLRTSYDVDRNASMGGDVEYRIDFARRWTFHFLGSIERSEAWNGAGVFSSLTYRF